MDNNPYKAAVSGSKRLIQDEHYYKYIFKKTERIVSVVFYILQSVPEKPKSEMHIEDISHSARHVHDAVLQSLEAYAHTSEDVVRASAHALVTLLSKLRVAHVAGVLPRETIDVLESEIDTVLRGMQRYVSGEHTYAFEDVFPKVEAPRRAPKQPQREGVSAKEERKDGQQIVGRRERIKTVLEAKGTASIKDISEIITDVSEKTIQRELNSMIEDNVVKRHGERRWSTYSIL